MILEFFVKFAPPVIGPIPELGGNNRNIKKFHNGRKLI